MINSNIRAVKKDARNLVKDAQELFHAAASLTGEQADDVRKRGLALLDSALTQAQHGQAQLVRTGRELSESAEHYVQENPWRTVALATSVGVVLGMMMSRR